MLYNNKGLHETKAKCGWKFDNAHVHKDLCSLINQLIMYLYSTNITRKNTKIVRCCEKWNAHIVKNK
jgi:hypothetical protein